MKQRLLAGVLSASMLLTTAPQALAVEDESSAQTVTAEAEDGLGYPTEQDSGVIVEDTKTLSLADGSITITAEGYKVGDGEQAAHTGKYVLMGTTTEHTVTVTGGEQEITLKDVNIDVSGDHSAGVEVCAFDIQGGSVKLMLEGENVLTSGFTVEKTEVNTDSQLFAAGWMCAGLSVEQGASVTIDGTGSLTAKAGDSTSYRVAGTKADGTAANRSLYWTNIGKASGIGVSLYWPGIKKDPTATVGDITIKGGTVTAIGSGNSNGYGGAGIGGGKNASSITINGGTVTAKAGLTTDIGAAGIGAAYAQSSQKTITINGGTVTAIGGSAGIGGGAYQSAGTVVINNGTVNATSEGYGAGIGGGGGRYRGGNDMGNSGSVTINGGTVTAQGGGRGYGAGIGGGGTDEQRGEKSGAQASGNITITGGVVKATGGQYAPGIGSGALGKILSDYTPLSDYAGRMGDIVISGGSVNAVNGTDFLASSADTVREANSYKTLDDKGDATVDSGIGQGRNASEASATAFASWKLKNGAGETLIGKETFSANSVTYSRNGGEKVTVDGADGQTVLYLPEGYYSFTEHTSDSSHVGTSKLIATAEDKAKAAAMVATLNDINSTSLTGTAFAEAVTDAEATYNTLSMSLRYYVDETVEPDHTISELKKQLKNKDIKVNVDFSAGTDDVVAVPASTQITFGATNVQLLVPTRKNYNFDGWYQGDRQMTGADGVVAEWDILANTTLTAHWVSEVTGDGTVDKPYLIQSADNLIALSHISLGIGTDAEYAIFGKTNTDNNYKSLMNAHYHLEKSVTLRTEDGFYGIGGQVYTYANDKWSSAYKYFYGTFDGGNGDVDSDRENEKVITLDIDTAPLVISEGAGDNDNTLNGHVPLAYAADGTTVIAHTEVVGGLFNYVQGVTIKNVITEGNVVLATKKNSAGVIAGMVSTGSASAVMNVTIENCINRADITVGTTFNVATAGGIIGNSMGANTTTIKNCENNGTVVAGAGLEIKDGTTTASQGNSIAAGICANASTGTAVFENCTNNGNITGTRQTDFAGRNTRAGGIAAILSNEAEFTDCTNTGDIKANSFSADAAAGIAVSIGKTKAFTNCTNSGAVYAATGTAGAIFGDLDTAGSQRNAELADCFQTVKADEKNDGWKLSTDEAVKVEKTDAGYVLRLPITGEDSNYFSEDRYIVNANGEKAADLYSGDGSTLYNDLTHNDNPTASEYPFQSESTAYVVSTAAQYTNLVKAIRGDAAAQNAVLGNRLSGATAATKAAVLATAHVKVTGDFTLSDVDAIGLGTDTLPFSGVVYGQDHTITYAVNETALPKTASEMIGFVGNAMGATVRDLNFAGSISVTTKEDNDNRLSIGAAVAAGSAATVENCSSTAGITVVHNGAVNNATMGMTYIGGLIGRQSAGGVVTNARYEGNITVTAPKNACAGGIAGSFVGSMEDVQALGDITANEKSNENIAKYGENSYAGGIAGIMDGALKDATAAGFIKATNDCTFANVYAYAGGLVGNTTNGLTVDTCKALTTVTATYAVKQDNAREGVILGNGNLNIVGDDDSITWYLKNDAPHLDNGNARAIETSLLEGAHTFGDETNSTMKAPAGVTLVSDLVERRSNGQIAFIKAGNDGAVELRYLGKPFYRTTVSVSPKTLTAADVKIAGVKNRYADQTEAEAALADIEVLDGSNKLVKGKDYDVVLDGGSNSFKITFKGNYAGETSYQYVIDAAAITASAMGVDCTYDGKEHSITVTVNTEEKYTVVYSESLSGGYTEKPILKKAAGHYVVYWQVLMGEGLNEGTTVVSGATVISIAKAKVVIKPDDKTMTVGGTLPEPTYTVTGLVGDEKLRYEPKVEHTTDGSKTGTFAIIAHDADAETHYEIIYEEGTLTVNGRGGSSSSSSSSSSTGASNTVSTPSAAGGKVSVTPSTAKKGDTVTITVTPESGYQLGKLTVTDAKGNTIAVTDKGNGKYTFTMPDGKVTVTPTFTKIAEQPSASGYTDVADAAWYADAVQYVTDKGLMTGTGSGRFSPNAPTTRGMLMTVLARYAGADTTGGSPWYQKGMEWAKANGVSDGTNPTVNITREQLVTMLYRYAGSPAASGSLTGFADASSVSGYAEKAMQWAVANGIVNGANGKLNPQNNATRAEVAAILMRFCEMSK